MEETRTVLKDTRYKVASLDTTAPIKFTSVALEHGAYISLIGSGGIDPAVLSSSTDNTYPVKSLPRRRHTSP